MPTPNSESLTLSTAAYVIFGAGVASFFTWLASWGLRFTERRRKRADDANAAEIQAEAEDRHNFRVAQQGLIDNLRRMIQETQTSLAATQEALRMAQSRLDDCELLHKADAWRISSLERENLSLQDRIAVLEKRVIDQD